MLVCTVMIWVGIHTKSPFQIKIEQARELLRYQIDQNRLHLFCKSSNLIIYIRAHFCPIKHLFQLTEKHKISIVRPIFLPINGPVVNLFPRVPAVSIMSPKFKFPHLGISIFYLISGKERYRQPIPINNTQWNLPIVELGNPMFKSRFSVNGILKIDSRFTYDGFLNISLPWSHNHREALQNKHIA